MYFRTQGEVAKAWVYDVENDPKFLYSLDKGTEFVTDKVFVHKEHVVIAPSWPLLANGIVMTLSIKDDLKVSGKFLFNEASKRDAIDQVRNENVQFFPPI